MTAGRPVVMVLRDANELAEMRALLLLLAGASEKPDAAREVVPVWESGLATFTQVGAQAGQHKNKAAWRSSSADQVAALYTLYSNSVFCALCTPETLFLRTPPADFFRSRGLRLYKGMDMPQDLILDQLTDWGYTRAAMVGELGEFSRRGDILDLYCPGYHKPVRLEFFGDSLDDLRLFDPASQRSRAKLEELTILPCQPVPPERALQESALQRWQALANFERLGENDLYNLRKALESGGAGLLPGMYYEKAAVFSDWLPEAAVLILPGRADLAAKLEELERTRFNVGLEARLKEELAPAREAEPDELYQPPSLVARSLAEVAAWLDSRNRACFEELKVGVEISGLDLPERAVNAFQDLFPLPSDLERPWQRLVAAMQEWSRPARLNESGRLEENRQRVILSFASERGRAKFLDLAGQDGIAPRLRLEAGQGGLFALVSPFRRGLNLLWDNTLILGEDVLQPRSDQGRAPRRSTEAFKGLDRYDELAPGDLLVHRDYGICAFGGLQHLAMESRNGPISNDFLLLRYAGDDKLYLPVDRLDLIQVFKAPDGLQPGLDRLGGSQWATSKEKARKAIERIAEDLVEMYAYRKVAKGFTYGPVDEMYREFEATFGFEETPDQARAIEDVLADMEKPEPMDRLVCGDVGFGKTEVALRAAFRAAMEGRQAALLCPTTVLAEQHYQTFRSRLAGFPLNVGLLSRFVSTAEQKETLNGLKRGQIDIVIGTHRLLSKDVALPSLGLIILDEEQRFGVRHKELLKQMRKNVDVLTLTATPIPRTLQLSLSGVRELSVIETPPPERKPVATALINRDDAPLRTVLERELARQGQVFWVYNRVQGLERAAEYVRKLVPQARIGMAHGQMNEKELEENMRRFWHGELDVLVCTSIIESGLDFPHANTLVVDQAQLFGLGQLYQLRGRVGRSDRQAFAIFVCNDVDALPEQTRKRLRIILEMDYLGAGLQVAMEDLRLRGAGNILGESQSGHMQRLGLDLFLEMLEEAVAKMRGQPLRESVETELNIGVEAHIPEQYIADSRERLRYYKTLSSTPEAAARREVEFELRDRFGPIPPQLENFLAVLSFKRHLSDWGVNKADIYPDRLKMHFSEKHARLDPAKLIAWVSASQGRARLQPPAALELMLAGGGFSDKLATAYEELLPILSGTDVK
ncbi:MAG: transcription-repair coupling factor [Deltaproteobacteria bacterium]|nr:transcription-repair coupling factor [Deltaproteobacteria bacterium]